MSRAGAFLREPHPDLPRRLDQAERVEVASSDDDEGFVQVPDDDTVSPGPFIRRRLSPETLLAIDRLEGDDQEDPHAGTHPLETKA